MKTNLYLFVAMATLIFAACSKETENAPQTGEKTARLELVLAGTPTVNGRATADALPTSEGNIKTIAVGVFNSSSGAVNVIAEPTVGAGNLLSDINCTSGTCDIVIVANAPAGTFAGVMTKNAFIAKTVALSTTATSNVQASDNLPMSGEEAGVVLAAGATVTKTISLSRLVARISIGSITTAFDANGAYKDATFKPEKVFLYNAMSTSTVAPTGQPTGTTPIHGGAITNNVFATGSPWLLDALIGTANNTAYSTPHWFYTFANDGKSTPTKLVIAGTFDADGAGTVSTAETVYYPIVVNKAQAGTTITGGAGSGDADNGTAVIKRNSAYNLTAIIKGKGVNNPADDINPATLKLTVEVAAWELTITQNVTFE